MKDNTMTKGPTVKAELIPKRVREDLARSLLYIAREAQQDPRIMKEFEAWKKQRQEAAQ